MTAVSSNQWVLTLEKLASLRASGALDETEFNKMKAELLAQQGQ
ncbi:MAG: SHOCT domain-containing protein [Rhizobiales bacterium]|nr:SHOCT domain-containing protein [Hyphomicrobiales bacterium]